MAESAEQQVDTRQHELSWLLRDAVGLFHLGRKCSSMLLLLCAVDALASRADPDNNNVRERFEAFLKKRLPRYTRIQNFNIRVPKLGKLCRLEHILYKYLRNPMVHEGAHLDMHEPSDFEACIDWSDGARYIRIDDELNQVVLGGDWVIEMLAGAVRDGLAEDLTTRCT